MVDTAQPGQPESNKHTQSLLVRGTINGSLAKDMVLGPLVVAFAVQVLGYSNGQISWFLSLIPLIVLVRYPFLDTIRTYPRIDVVKLSRYFQASCLIALLVLPLDWITVPVLFALAVWFIFGNEFLQNAVWMNLVAEVTSHQDRGRFLGRLRTWKQATNMAFSVVAFFIVGDHLSRGEHRVLLLIVIALLINSLIWYRSVPATPPPADIGTYSGRKQFWPILRRHPMMRRPLVLTFAIAVLQWPILIVYVVGSLNLPANLLMLTVSCSMLGSIVSEYVWGISADRLGIRRLFQVYFFGSLLISPLIFLWSDYGMIQTGSQSWFISTIALLIFYFATGVLNAGHQMAMSMYRAQFLDQQSGFHALNVLTAVNQLFVAALTGIGGIILVVLAEPTQVTDVFRVVTVVIMTATIVFGLWVTHGIRPHHAADKKRLSGNDGLIGLTSPKRGEQ